MQALAVNYTISATTSHVYFVNPNTRSCKWYDQTLCRFWQRSPAKERKRETLSLNLLRSFSIGPLYFLRHLLKPLGSSMSMMGLVVSTSPAELQKQFSNLTGAFLHKRTNIHRGIILQDVAFRPLYDSNLRGAFQASGPIVTVTKHLLLLLLFLSLWNDKKKFTMLKKWKIRYLKVKVTRKKKKWRK